ncbi:MAG: radical SAM protein, partial [Gammaproteobacteria bacterium]|nr:radical SAM protein [Gammaproteobacteria bacterium]
PHLHLSLQSGNTLILKRMKRRYTRELVYDRVAALRARIPNLVLSADVMVGFPTETDEQYQDTVDMVRDLPVAYPHVFRYSQRSDTPAARIPKQVPGQVKKRRAAHLRSVAAQVRDSVLRSRIGHSSRILVEGGGQPPRGYHRGRAGDYLPVYVPADAAAVGQWLRVQFAAVRDATLIARPV